jgi:hypothetical protein
MPFLASEKPLSRDLIQQFAEGVAQQSCHSKLQTERRKRGKYAANLRGQEVKLPVACQAGPCAP